MLTTNPRGDPSPSLWRVPHAARHRAFHRTGHTGPPQPRTWRDLGRHRTRFPQWDARLTYFGRPPRAAITVDLCWLGESVAVVAAAPNARFGVRCEPVTRTRGA
jgi:hypothetical protein